MIPALVKQAGGTVQDHSWLHSVFEFSMGCMRLVSRGKNEKKPPPTKTTTYRVIVHVYGP